MLAFEELLTADGYDSDCPWGVSEVLDHIKVDGLHQTWPQKTFKKFQTNQFLNTDALSSICTTDVMPASDSLKRNLFRSFKSFICNPVLNIYLY